MAIFDIVVKSRASLQSYGEPSRFVSSYSCIITATDDETGEVKKVGRIRAMRIHAGLALNARESLFDVCDTHSTELNNLYALLYEPSGFMEAVVDRFDAFESDLLVLDFVALSPKWRGLKLGLLAVRKFVDMVGGGCGLAVSHIAPLRRDAAKLLGVPTKWIPRQGNKEERREAKVRLRQYFKRMGFVRLGRTPFYALPLNQVTPSAGELLGGVPPESL